MAHDIDEAVYLGDRVLATGANPGRVIADVSIDLGRSRDQIGTKMRPRYGELRKRVFELVMRRETDQGGIDPAKRDAISQT